MIAIQGSWLLPLVPVLFNLLHASSTGKKQLQQAAFSRLALYLFLMLYRSFVIYLGLNHIEILVFSSPSECFYSTLRHDSSCLRAFDHADHVVLFLTHFVLIAWLEMYELSHEWRQRSRQHVLAICAYCTTLLLVVSYMMFHTCYSFHRLEENITVWLVAAVAVVWPLHRYFPSFAVVAKKTYSYR